MAIFNIAYLLVFLACIAAGVVIGWLMLKQMTSQTAKLIAVLMDSVVRSSEAAKQSSENAQKIVAILQEQLKEK